MVDVVHPIDLLPEYALDILEPEEEALVSQHLAGCPTCRAELASYEAVVAELALAVPEAAPFPTLRDRLLAQTQPVPGQASRAPQPAAWWQSLGSLWSRPVLLGGLISLLLILGLAAGNLWLWQRVNRLEARPMRTVALAGTEAAPGASGLIVISADGEHGTLVVEGLPVLSPQQQYQLWLIQDGRRVSGGVFSVNEGGYCSEGISAPEPLSHFSAFGVSVEPAGGSLAPTGPRVLGGAVN